MSATCPGWPRMTCDVGDHGDLSTPCRPFSTFCCKQRSWAISTLGSPNVFHWVTQRFPLGHPRFPTGSPKGLDPSRSLKIRNAAARNDQLRRLSNQYSKRKANMSSKNRLKHSKRWARQFDETSKKSL